MHQGSVILEQCDAIQWKICKLNQELFIIYSCSLSIGGSGFSLFWCFLFISTLYAWWYKIYYLFRWCAREQRGRRPPLHWLYEDSKGKMLHLHTGVHRALPTDSHYKRLDICAWLNAVKWSGILLATCQLDIFADSSRCDPRHGLDSWTFKKMADPTGFHICVSPSNILQLRQPLVEWMRAGCRLCSIYFHSWFLL